jgi:60 kDa SS-A/Ro ribonucleoprotein
MEGLEMPSKYAQHTSRRTTPQSRQAHADQVKNSAGGWSFKVDKWVQLQRFLILGTEGGTYYICEPKLTRQNVGVLDACAAEDHEKLVNLIVSISEEGRAPKNTPAIFALAYLSGHNNVLVRRAALDAMPKVCRTGTHLFQFLADVEEFRGWGRTLRDAVSNWYLSKDPRALAYQVVKYQQREGESHVDALRRSHTKSDEQDMREVLAYASKKLLNLDEESVKEDRMRFHTTVRAGANLSNWLADPKPHRQVLAAVEAAKKAKTEGEIIRLIEQHDLVRECIPTEFLNSKKVWDALLVKMPMTAMLRNLGKMTSIGLVAPMSDATGKILESFGNQEAIRKSRIHPIQVLLALTTYNQGRGVRGKLAWNPVPQVGDVLDEAFYMAFENVVLTNKRWMIGLDISGSMSSDMAGTFLSCAQGAGALAMVTVRSEKQYYLHGFSHEFVDLTKDTTYQGYSWGSNMRRGTRIAGISAKSKLQDVVNCMFAHNMGGTDCSLPMTHALKHQIPVDVFAVYTDSETWYGGIHPHQALDQYRRQMGIQSKLIVVGMEANQFTIADPSDVGMLDVVGFDSTVPAVMADFARQ